MTNPRYAETMQKNFSGSGFRAQNRAIEGRISRYRTR